MTQSPEVVAVLPLPSIEQYQIANIDSRLRNLHPESINWKRTHGEAVDFTMDRLITNEIANTQHSNEFRDTLKKIRGKARIAARYHDIGLLNLGKDVTQEQIEAIVNKEDKLNEREKDIMNRHPLAGVKVLREVGVDDPFILAVVALHHTLQDEPFTPYPSLDDPEVQGILHAVPAGERDMVDYVLQLLVLADVVHTIREKRPYDDAKPSDIAYGHAHMEGIWDGKQIYVANRAFDKTFGITSQGQRFGR